MSGDGLLPVTVLTGYLGSGKTTLLRRLLEGEAGRRTAVVINEFGEISLDHLLVKEVSGNTVVLQNGCVCCSVRLELRVALRELLDEESRGGAAWFDRIVIETTGLADPVPLVQTLTVDPMLRHRLRLSRLIATVDGMNGRAQLDAQPEAVRQAAIADRLVITKADLCAARDLSALRDTLAAVNPMAKILCGQDSATLWPALFDEVADDPRTLPAGTRRGVLRAEAVAEAPAEAARHREAVTSFVFRTTRSIDWTAFAVWLSLLVHRHGRNVLRVKGLLSVAGAAGPVSLNVVQHFIHPPVHLEGWPDTDHSSRLVFILQGLSAAAIRQSLETMLQRAECQPAGDCDPREGRELRRVERKRSYP